MKKEIYEKYDEAFRRAVEFLKKFYEEHKDDSEIRIIMPEAYVAEHMDPDDKAVRIAFGIKCKADGLHSVRRICALEENAEDIVAVYIEYRKTPIIFFPSEAGGINTSRSRILGDRIDHTLYDLKMYFAGRADECLLKKAYSREKTNSWLQQMGSFENLIDWLGVKGIFTDENYGVYDLEYDDGRVITSYRSPAEYQRQWSIAYYNNLKKKILKF